jgi:DNA-binding NarL/FixJ family response regulator
MAAEASREAEGAGADSPGLLHDLLDDLIRHVAAGNGRMTVDVPHVGRVVLIGESELAAIEQSAALAEAERPSPRELEVLSLIARGMSAPQAAQSLRLSPSTINQHLATTRRKLGVSRSAEAVVIARQHGWLGEDLHVVADVRGPEAG